MCGFLALISVGGHAVISVGGDAVISVGGDAGISVGGDAGRGGTGVVDVRTSAGGRAAVAGP